MAKEEVLLQLALFEQEIARLEQQMQLIEQNVLEIENLKESLEELEKSKEKEIYANLGKNIFIKTEIKDKNLLIDVGNRTFAKKNIEETLKIIDGQLKQLGEAKTNVLSKMQEIQGKTEEAIEEAQKEEK